VNCPTSAIRRHSSSWFQQKSTPSRGRRSCLAISPEISNAQHFLARALLRRTVDLRIAAAVSRVLFGGRVDWAVVDRENAGHRRPEQSDSFHLRTALLAAPAIPPGSCAWSRQLAKTGDLGRSSGIRPPAARPGVSHPTLAQQLGDLLAEEKLQDEAMRNYSELVGSTRRIRCRGGSSATSTCATAGTVRPTASQGADDPRRQGADQLDPSGLRGGRRGARRRGAPDRARGRFRRGTPGAGRSALLGAVVVCGTAGKVARGQGGGQGRVWSWTRVSRESRAQAQGAAAVHRRRHAGGCSPGKTSKARLTLSIADEKNETSLAKPPTPGWSGFRV